MTRARYYDYTFARIRREALEALLMCEIGIKKGLTKTIPSIRIESDMVKIYHLDGKGVMSNLFIFGYYKLSLIAA